MSARSPSEARPPTDATPRRPQYVWYRSRFFYTVFAILTASQLYVGWRLIGPAQLPDAWRSLAWVIVAAFVVAVPLSFWAMSTDNPPAWAPLWRRWHVTILGLVFITLSLVALRDVLWLAAWPTGLLPDAPSARVAWLQSSNLFIGVGLAAASLHGYYLARRPPPIKRITVPVPGLAPALEGLTVTQISDLHVSSGIRREFVERVVELVNSTEADLIAVTGDLVDGSPDELLDDVAPLADLKAQHGVFFVPGNHDYYSGMDVWEAPITELGMRVLINASAWLEIGDARLLVAGLSDPAGERLGSDHLPDVSRALADAAEADFCLLLAHRPSTALLAAERPVGLALAGHTHGGQMVPFNLLVSMVQPVVAGLCRMGQGWLYVSRGTGFWGPPLRVGVSSEITVLELVRDGG